jgi:hypothetical protein
MFDQVLILYGRQNIAILEHNKEKCNSMAICVMCPNTTKYYSITWITQSIKIFSRLAKTAQYDFHRYFRLPSEKQEIPLEE